MSRHHLLSTLSILAVSAIIDAPVAFAADELRLEEITVTARKQSESLMAVPVAVTAISADAIQDRGIRDPLVDVATYTPGFSFQNQSGNRNDRGFKVFTVRGINPASPQFFRQAATVFIDGSPIAGGNVEGVTNIERVEVVKGPQSAYFGRATFSGALNYITRSPGDEYSASADVTVASWGTTDIYLAAEGPLIEDKLSARVAGHAYHTGGQYTNMMVPQGAKLGERNTKSVSVTVAGTPTDQLKIKAFVNLWQDDDGAPANAAINVDNGFNCNAGAAPTTARNYFCGAIRVAPQDTRVQNTIVSPAVLQALFNSPTAAHGSGFLDHFGLKRNAWQAHLYLDYTFQNDYVLSGNAAFDKSVWYFLTDTVFRDTRNVPNANFGRIANVLPYYSRTAYNGADERDNTAEIRFTSPRSDRFKWMGGANYQYQQNLASLSSFQITGLAAGAPASSAPFWTRTLGVFASAGYDIGAGFSITGEARYQWDTLHSEANFGAVVAHDTFKAFTPRVSLQYQPTSDLTIYGSYAEGTRPGEFNTSFFQLTPFQQAQVVAATGVAVSVPEERMRMGELGVKGLFLDGRLRILADVYYGYWKNRHINNQISLLRPDGSFDKTQPIISGGGEVRLKGFELEFEARVVPELTLEGTLSIAESEIVRTVCTDCILITGNRAPVGTQLPTYPKVKGTLSATYQRTLFDDVDGYIRTDYIYTGKIYDTEANVAWIVPRSTVNLRVGVERANTRLEVYGTNIFDNRSPSALARATDNLTGGNAITLSLGDKASYGIRLSTKF